MGLAQQGVIIASGDNLMIQGANPAGVAIQGQVIWRTAAEAPWQLLANVTTQAPIYTSAAIDTTGASLLVAALMRYTLGTPSFTDSLGNTWAQGVDVVAPGYAGSRIYYCLDPTTSASHTFTLSGITASSFAVIAFKGPTATMVNPVSSSVEVGVTSIQLPSIAPTVPSLIVTATGTGGTIGSIDSGFTICSNVPNTPGATYGGSAAYLIQSAAEAVAPTWTLAASGSQAGTAATMLSFQSA